MVHQFSLISKHVCKAYRNSYFQVGWFVDQKYNCFLFSMFLSSTLILWLLFLWSSYFPNFIATFPQLNECFWGIPHQFFPSPLIFLTEINFFSCLTTSSPLLCMFVRVFFQFFMFCPRIVFSLNLRTVEASWTSSISAPWFSIRSMFWYFFLSFKLIWCHRCSRLFEIRIHIYWYPLSVSVLRYACTFQSYVSSYHDNISGKSKFYLSSPFISLLQWFFMVTRHSYLCHNESAPRLPHLRFFRFPAFSFASSKSSANKKVKSILQHQIICALLLLLLLFLFLFLPAPSHQPTNFPLSAPRASDIECYHKHLKDFYRHQIFIQLLGRRYGSARNRGQHRERYIRKKGVVIRLFFYKVITKTKFVSQSRLIGETIYLEPC